MAEIEAGRRVQYGPNEKQINFAFIGNTPPSENPNASKMNWEPVPGYTAIDANGVEYPTKYQRRNIDGSKRHIDMWPAFDPRVRWGDYYYDVRGSKTPEDMEQDFRHNYSAAERKKEYERAAWAARENIKELQTENAQYRKYIRGLREKLPKAIDHPTIFTDPSEKVQLQKQIDEANNNIHKNLLKEKDIIEQTWGYDRDPPPIPPRERAQHPEPNEAGKQEYPYAYHQYVQGLRNV